MICYDMISNPDGDPTNQPTDFEFVRRRYGFPFVGWGGEGGEQEAQWVFIKRGSLVLIISDGRAWLVNRSINGARKPEGIDQPSFLPSFKHTCYLQLAHSSRRALGGYVSQEYVRYLHMSSRCVDHCCSGEEVIKAVNLTTCSFFRDDQSRCLF